MWCNIWPPCSPTPGVLRTWRSSCWWSRRDGTARRWQRPMTDSCWQPHNLLPLALLLSPMWPFCRSPRRCYRWWRNPVSSPPPPGHCCLHTQSCRWLHGLGTGRRKGTSDVSLLAVNTVIYTAFDAFQWEWCVRVQTGNTERLRCLHCG